MSQKKWPGQSLITLLAWAYLLFVIYGSLVPFNYQPMLAPERLNQFLDLQQFDWSRQSRADVVTNILLAMPLAFFWCAVFTAGGRRAPALAPILAWIGSLCVGVFVEWAQIYFPPRDPSLVDVTAQAFGAGLGVCLWSIWGRRFLEWVAGFRLLTTIPSLSMRLLALYAAGLSAYGLFPLDLTLSTTDIYRKWRDGHVLFVPFMQWQSMNAMLLYGFLTDIALWIPIGFLARLSFRRPIEFIVIVGTIAAALLEFLQLFVMSRTTDMTQVVAASIGTAIGARLLGRSRSLPAVTSTSGAVAGVSVLANPLLAIGWLLLLCAIFWYPYNFQATLDAKQAEDIIAGIPLEAMFYQSELRSVTELMRKLIFFAPLGVLLGFAAASTSSSRFGSARLFIAALPIFSGAALIECGKLFLPGKFPSGTNVAIEFFGGLMGYWAATAWHGWQRRTLVTVAAFPSALHSSSQRESPTSRVDRISNRSLLAAKLSGAILLLGTLLWIFSKVPQVPYNFRNLPHPQYPYLSMLLIASTLIWCVGFPNWAVRRMAMHANSLTRYPLWIVVYGFVVWGLTFLAVEPMRVYKLVGAPILQWPWHTEWLLRMLALMAAIGEFAVLGCILGSSIQHMSKRFALWLLHAAWLLPLTYWAVVMEAATDNIVELLAWNASPMAAGLIGLMISVIFFAAVRLSAVFSRVSIGQRMLSFTLVLLSFPLGYLFLLTATEPIIMKYGKVFSGMQFILSADREHYAEGGTLLARYLALHLFLTLAAVMGRFLFTESSRDLRRV